MMAKFWRWLCTPMNHETAYGLLCAWACGLIAGVALGMMIR